MNRNCINLYLDHCTVSKCYFNETIQNYYYKYRIKMFIHYLDLLNTNNQCNFYLCFDSFSTDHLFTKRIQTSILSSLCNLKRVRNIHLEKKDCLQLSMMIAISMLSYLMDLQIFPSM
jgi:hypothetical protein